MSQRARKLVALCSCLAVCCLLACQGAVSVGDGGITASFTIGGKTFTFTLGNLGRIEARANQTVSVGTNATALFTQNPADTPASGTVSLPSSSVGVFDRRAEKGIPRQQSLPLNGTAIIRILMAPGTSADPCADGTLLGEFDVVFTYGVPAVLQEAQDLTQQALQLIATNNVTLCVEVSADFDGDFTLGDFTLTFGGGSGASSAVFNLRNTDEFQNIHILLPDEDFDASNRLVPGSQRSLTLTDVDLGDEVTVRAGRNATVLDTATCPAILGANYDAQVVWDGFNLTCTATQDEEPEPTGTLQVPIDNAAGQAVAAPETDTFNTVPYGIVGVLNAQTLDVPGTSPEPDQISFNLNDLGLQSVDRLYMATASAFVPDVDDGVTLATLTVDYAEGGTPTVFQFVAGTTTAEWSYDRPEHDTLIGGVQHAIAPELYSFPTTIDSSSEYTGYTYSATLALDSARTISCMTLDVTDGATLAGLRNPDLAAEPTWAAQAIMGITLEGQAGTPSTVGDCLGVTPGIQTGTVTGTVVDAETGDPIAGATVTVDTQVVTTGADGRFTVADVLAGAVLVEASADGYQSGQTNATVSAGQTVDVTIELTAEIDPIGTLRGTVTDADTGLPLAGATVRLDYSPGPSINATSAADGTYQLLAPETVDVFALVAAAENYVPQATNVETAQLEGTTLTIDFALEPVSLDVVVIEVIPDVHHLGDDNFSGTINSQFQKSAEGTEFTTSFTASAGQLPPAFSAAELRMLAKGAEFANPIRINGTALDGFLSGTPGDGSFGEVVVPFDIGLIVEGANTIAIESLLDGDYDDFEFVNAQIRLTP